MPSTERLRFPGGLTPNQVSEAIQKRVASDPAGSLAEARRALALAREEKGLANAHRNRARAEMFRYEEFKRNLEETGIEVIFEPGPEKRAQSINHQGPRRSK